MRNSTTSAARANQKGECTVRREVLLPQFLVRSSPPLKWKRDRAEAGVIPGYFGGDHVGLSEVVDETLPKGLHSSPLLSSSLLPVSVSISAVFFFRFRSALKSFSPPALSSFLAPQRLLPLSHNNLTKCFFTYFCWSKQSTH